MRPRALAAWRLVIRAIDRLPGLRQLHWQPPLRRWYFPVRTTALVSPALPFLANELLRRPLRRRYRLAEPGWTVAVRHPLNDMWIIDEIFMQRVYEPPQEVLATLSGLRRPPRILDLGGHAGFFALFVLERFPDAHVTSVEPNPENLALLSAAREANGLQARWDVVPAAAGVAAGTLRLSGESFLTRVGGEGDVEVPVRDALPLIDAADLLKIDIEGGEWPVFADARLRTAGVRAVVAEVHSTGDGDQEFGERAIAALQAQGFRCGPLFDIRPDTACVWAWR